MSPILVTGAGGNVGQQVVRGLLARGLEVVSSDRQEARVRGLFGDAVVASPLPFVDTGPTRRCSSR
jgi:nucleoside-diphosphate-sugar epimerase